MPDVTTVRALGGYRVHLEFADGATGELDLGELITFRGVFAALRDESEFAKVKVDPDLGTITWPTGADVCPDVLYERMTGKATTRTTAGDGS